MAESRHDFGCQAHAVGKQQRLPGWDKQRGFTLLELLVVIAITAVLTGLLLPAISRSKSRAQAITCMNNNKQLLLAWTMYAGDNDTKLANNQQVVPGNSSQSAVAANGNPNWVNNVMDWETSPDNTNLDFVNHSSVAPYASYSPNLFHCPADKVLSTVQRRAGWTGGRVRSVSMNAMVGDPGPALKWGFNTNNPSYQQFLRESDILSPSMIFVFLDEHPDSINDGYFLARDNAQWTDLPASYHDGGGSFSFADGHTVIHRWQCASTLCPPVPDGAGLPISLRANELADLEWVLQHSSVER